MQNFINYTGIVIQVSIISYLPVVKVWILYLKAVHSPSTTHGSFRGKFCPHVLCNYSLKRIGTNLIIPVHVSNETTLQTDHFLITYVILGGLVK